MSEKKVSFWRVFWPSLIAGFAVIAIIFMFFTTVIGSMFTGAVSTSSPTSNKTILQLNLSDEIAEVADGKINIDLFNMGIQSKIGLAGLLHGFEKAATDNSIKGIYIELTDAMCGFATATEIRNAIKRFQDESGKFVVAYHSGEVISLKQYYIASAANESYGFHSTNMDFRGLGAELMFFKGLADKLEIEMQVIRGSNNDFKSAVEPYFLKEISDSSRLQIETYLTNIWTEIKTSIGKDRNISVAELDALAESGKIRKMTDAVTFKLINDTKYKDEILTLLAEKVEVKDVKDLNLMSFEKYAQSKLMDQQNIANAKGANIAVIIAEGGIAVNGDGIASTKLTKLIREARNDKDIKTIVLRVNSPGGSALASEEIWREVKLANDEKKVIISMGDVAASGGYYIAAPGYKIFAEENTITGSIGVFGMIPYAGKAAEDKLGLTFDRVATNKFAAPMSLFKKLTPEEFAIVQDEVDYIYDEFLGRVSEGRGLSKEQVNVVARGRVWTGRDALRVGLVDTIGGVKDAIAYAAKEAGIDKPIVRYYPRLKKEAWADIVESFKEETTGSTGDNSKMTKELIQTYRQIKSIENIVGIQARLPYMINW